MSDLHSDPVKRPPEYRGAGTSPNATVDPMRRVPERGSGFGLAAMIGGVAILALLAWFMLAGNDTPVTTEPASPATNEAPVTNSPAADVPAAEPAPAAADTPTTEAPATEPPATTSDETQPDPVAPDAATPDATTPGAAAPDPAAPAAPIEPAPPATGTNP